MAVVVKALNNVHRGVEPKAQWERAVQCMRGMSNLEIANAWIEFSSPVASLDTSTAIVRHSQYRELFKRAVKEAAPESTGGHVEHIVTEMTGKLEEYEKMLSRYRYLSLLLWTRKGKDSRSVEELDHGGEFQGVGLETAERLQQESESLVSIGPGIAAMQTKSAEKFAALQQQIADLSPIWSKQYGDLKKQMEASTGAIQERLARSDEKDETVVRLLGETSGTLNTHSDMIQRLSDGFETHISNFKELTGHMEAILEITVSNKAIIESMQSQEKVDREGLEVLTRRLSELDASIKTGIGADYTPQLRKEFEGLQKQTKLDFERTSATVNHLNRDVDLILRIVVDDLSPGLGGMTQDISHIYSQLANLEQRVSGHQSGVDDAAIPKARAEKNLKLPHGSSPYSGAADPSKYGRVAQGREPVADKTVHASGPSRLPSKPE